MGLLDDLIAEVYGPPDATRTRAPATVEDYDPELLRTGRRSRQAPSLPDPRWAADATAQGRPTTPQTPSASVQDLLGVPVTRGRQDAARELFRFDAPALPRQEGMHHEILASVDDGLTETGPQEFGRRAQRVGGQFAAGLAEMPVQALGGALATAAAGLGPAGIPTGLATKEGLHRAYQAGRAVDPALQAIDRVGGGAPRGAVEYIARHFGPELSAAGAVPAGKKLVDFAVKGVRNIELRSTLGSTYAILTAANPGGTSATKLANARAMRELHQTLTAQGLRPIPSVGRYLDDASGEVLEEPSFLVPGLPEAQAIELGKQYGQNSVITPRGFINLTDGTVHPRTGVKVSGKLEENFTESEIRGGPVRFGLDFDWSTRQPLLAGGPGMEGARGPRAAMGYTDVGGAPGRVLRDQTDELRWEHSGGGHTPFLPHGFRFETLDDGRTIIRGPRMRLNRPGEPERLGSDIWASGQHPEDAYATFVRAGFQDQFAQLGAPDLGMREIPSGPPFHLTRPELDTPLGPPAPAPPAPGGSPRSAGGERIPFGIGEESRAMVPQPPSGPPFHLTRPELDVPLGPPAPAPEPPGGVTRTAGSERVPFGIPQPPSGPPFHLSRPELDIPLRAPAAAPEAPGGPARSAGGERIPFGIGEPPTARPKTPGLGCVARPGLPSLCDDPGALDRELAEAAAAPPPAPPGQLTPEQHRAVNQLDGYDTPWAPSLPAGITPYEGGNVIAALESGQISPDALDDLYRAMDGRPRTFRSTAGDIPVDGADGQLTPEQMRLLDQLQGQDHTPGTPHRRGPAPRAPAPAPEPLASAMVGAPAGPARGAIPMAGPLGRHLAPSILAAPSREAARGLAEAAGAAVGPVARGPLRALGRQLARHANDVLPVVEHGTSEVMQSEPVQGLLQSSILPDHLTDEQKAQLAGLLGIAVAGGAGAAVVRGVKRGRMKQLGRLAGGLDDDAARLARKRGDSAPATGRADEYASLATFALDPTGEARLRAEIEQIGPAMIGDPKERVTWAQTRAMASEIGLDHLQQTDVSTRLSGPEMLGIRNLVNRNVNALEGLYAQLQNGPDPQVDQMIAAVEQQNESLLARFIANRARTGRDLNNLKILANRIHDPAFWRMKAQNIAQQGGRTLSHTETRQLDQLVLGGDTQALVKFLMDLQPSTTANKVTTLWKAGLLTNPATHLANITGNTAMAALELTKDAPAAVFDRALGYFTGARTKDANVLKGAAASLRGAHQGLREARLVLRGLPDESALRRWEIPLQTNYETPILNAYTQGVFNMLGAQDRVFRGMALARSLDEQARVLAKGDKALLKSLRGAPTDEMVIQAIADAEYATFTRQTDLTGAIGKVRSAINQRTGGVGGDLVLPFTRTPTNVAGVVVDYTPVGFGRAAASTVQLYKLVNRGAPQREIREMQRLAANRAGRATVGLVPIIVGYKLAAAGLATGARPGERSEGQQDDLEGRQNNSVKLNGTWRSVTRLSPLGNLIALGANLYEITHNPELDELEAAGGAVASVGTTLLESPFLQGADQVQRALKDPVGAGGDFVGNLVGSAVPAAVGAAARGLDPTIRETEAPSDGRTGMVPAVERGLATAGNEIRARLPGASRALPAARDQFGQPKQRTGGVFTQLFDFTRPRTDARADDPVIAELSRVGATVAQLQRRPNEPIQDYQARQETVGMALYEALADKMLNDSSYRALDPIEQKDVLERVVRKIRLTAGRQ